MQVRLYVIQAENLFPMDNLSSDPFLVVRRSQCAKGRVRGFPVEHPHTHRGCEVERLSLLP